MPVIRTVGEVAVAVKFRVEPAYFGYYVGVAAVVCKPASVYCARKQVVFTAAEAVCGVAAAFFKRKTDYAFGVVVFIVAKLV